MKNLGKKMSVGLMALVAGVLSVVNSVKAAADTDLVNGLASTTLIFTDNKGTIITWVVGIFAVTIVVALLIRALFFGKRQAVGMLPGGKRRR